MTQPSGQTKARYAWALALAIQAIVIWFEWISSHRSHSQALISDILHNSIDIVLVMVTALPLVVRLEPRAQQAAKSFSAVTNVVAFIAAGMAAIVLGLRSFDLPEQVIYSLAWPAAVASVVGNFLIFKIVEAFRQDHGAKVFGWHQLWDVGAALGAAVCLFLGSQFNLPYVDGVGSILIGVFMLLHWLVDATFNRNGHNHCH